MLFLKRAVQNSSHPAQIFRPLPLVAMLAALPGWAQTTPPNNTIANQISSIVQNTIDTGSFTSFTLSNISNTTILTDTLGIGALAYLNSLTINGSYVSL